MKHKYADRLNGSWVEADTDGTRYAIIDDPIRDKISNQVRDKFRSYLLGDLCSVSSDMPRASIYVNEDERKTTAMSRLKKIFFKKEIAAALKNAFTEITLSPTHLYSDSMTLTLDGHTYMFHTDDEETIVISLQLSGYMPPVKMTEKTLEELESKLTADTIVDLFKSIDSTASVFTAKINDLTSNFTSETEILWL